MIHRANRRGEQFHLDEPICVKHWASLLARMQDSMSFTENDAIVVYNIEFNLDVHVYSIFPIIEASRKVAGMGTRLHHGNICCFIRASWYDIQEYNEL